jgi:hypothetical protein
MRVSWRWLWLIPLLSCQHAQTTDVDRPASAKATDSNEGGSGGPATQKAHLPDANGRISDPGHPVLSVSPVGLRKPGGTEKLEVALNKAGFLQEPSAANEGDVRQALIRFQAKHELAKTGFADHETLRQLGLNPNDIDMSQMPRTSPDASTP